MRKHQYILGLYVMELTICVSDKSIYWRKRNEIYVLYWIFKNTFEVRGKGEQNLYTWISVVVQDRRAHDCVESPNTPLSLLPHTDQWNLINVHSGLIKRQNLVRLRNRLYRSDFHWILNLEMYTTTFLVVSKNWRRYQGVSYDLTPLK